MKNFRYSVILGFTIFAIMFGAGNVILPPDVGYFAGRNFFIAILAFVATSAGFAAIGVCSMALQKNNFLDVTRKIHPKTHIFLLTAVVLILGPLFAGPRTSIITNELFVREVFNSSHFVIYAISSFVFFTISAIILLSGTKLTDVIGKYLTPALLILLTILIGGAIFANNPYVESSATAGESISFGLSTGYFTVDALGYVILSTISIKAILTERSMKHHEKTGVLMRSVLIALFLVALVYIGLGYMGATSTLPMVGESAPEGIAILKHNIDSTFGKFGIILFGLAVSLACLTTSIGLLANTSNFFAQNTKIDQRIYIIFFAFVAFVISLLPLAKLTDFVGPILIMLVPASMSIAFLGFINSKVRKRKTLVVPFVVSIIMGASSSFIQILSAVLLYHNLFCFLFS